MNEEKESCEEEGVEMRRNRAMGRTEGAAGWIRVKLKLTTRFKCPGANLPF